MGVAVAPQMCVTVAAQEGEAVGVSVFIFLFLTFICLRWKPAKEMLEKSHQVYF